MNEQEWISVKDQLPTHNDNYLVAIDAWDHYQYQVVRFATNLKKIDKYDFYDKNGAGFYYYDGEYGYIELDDVVYWMPIPKLTKGE